MSQTHRLVGGSSAFVATSAVGVPWGYVCVAIACAAGASSMPDDAEKLLHFKHRKITHRPALQLAFFASLVAAAATWTPEYVALIAVGAAAMAFGCVMHSVADAMTVHPDGIQLLWPLSRRGYHLLPWSMRVWVGSKSTSERVFVAMWTAFVIIYSYARFGHLIST